MPQPLPEPERSERLVGCLATAWSAGFWRSRPAIASSEIRFLGLPRLDYAETHTTYSDFAQVKQQLLLNRLTLHGV